MSYPPGILARGPWSIDQVTVAWREDPYAATADQTAAADAKIAELAERGSPSHDGLAARMAGFTADNGGLQLDMQPVRWAIRLLEEGGASGSIAALCVTRDAQGRWLAGRRALWLASWAGRWALGAGGAVEVGESPTDTLTRELEEEWSVAPERVQGEALLALPSGMIMFIGQAWLPDGAQVTMDEEHDEYAWWPADPSDWPEQADPALRYMAGLLL